MIIAIDGTVCSGKSTIAKTLAKELGFGYFSAGSIYRAIALKTSRNNIKLTDEKSIVEMLKNTKIEITFADGESKTLLDGEDVSSLIRSPEITMLSAKVAILPKVREYVRKIEHLVGDNFNIVIEGRDIGTVVFPNAEVKIFMTASEEVRTKRRMADFEKKGIIFSYEEALSDLRERDKADMTRKDSPLKKAEDAIEFDNSSYTLEQSLEKLKKIISKNLKSNRTNNI